MFSSRPRETAPPAGYLQSGEAFALVGGQLCVDELGEKELPELRTLEKKTTDETGSVRALELDLVRSRH